MLELSLNRAEGPGAPPLYEQLYKAISGQIAQGQIKTGERLPGKRRLAAELALSVNTVDAAYQQLAAEGWVEARPRSGFFAAEYRGPLQAPAPCPEEQLSTTEAPAFRYDLSTGTVDTSLFPFHSWGRIQRELIYNRPDLLAHGDPQGDADLRIAITNYLQAYRGVDCSPDQLVVGAGVEYLLGLLGRLLGGACAAVEDPGYKRTRTILQNSGLRCIPVPVDNQGLDPIALAQSNASVVYVTPSHQFPTGAVMPVGRRASLLRWADAAQGRLIIEDDYDSEFHFRVRPMPSLQGMAGRNGRVIYLATFSRSLAPSIRIAYMVLPRWLLKQFRITFGSYSSTVSRFEQQTLRVFLQKGHYVRHLARCRSQYLQRMQQLTGELNKAFGEGKLSFYGRHTGLHLLLQFQDGPGEEEMVRRARQAGIAISGLSEYSLGPAPLSPGTVVLGYGGLKPEQITPLALLLHQLWTQPEVLSLSAASDLPSSQNSL